MPTNNSQNILLQESRTPEAGELSEPRAPSSSSPTDISASSSGAPVLTLGLDDRCPPLQHLHIEISTVYLFYI